MSYLSNFEKKERKVFKGKNLLFVSPKKRELIKGENE